MIRMRRFGLGSVYIVGLHTLLWTPTDQLFSSYSRNQSAIHEDGHCFFFTNGQLDNSLSSTKPSQEHTRHVSHPLQTRHVLEILFDGDRSSYQPD